MHALAKQLSPAAHAVAQAPQLLVSVVVSTQVPPQLTVGALQGETHTPMAQSSPVAHAIPQAPQLAGSLAVSTQVEPQRVSPLPQPAPESAGLVSLGAESAVSESAGARVS
jgi:hypothetical protein